MKKLYGSFWAKLLAVFLLCAFALALALSLLGIVANYEWGSYDYGYSHALSSVISGTGQNYLYNVGWDYARGLNDLETRYLDTNFRFTVTDAKGETLASTYDGEESLWDGELVQAPEYWVERYEPDWERLYEQAGATPTPAPTLAVVTPFPVETAEDGRTLVPSTPEPTPEPRIQVSLYAGGETVSLADDAALAAWIEENSVTIHGYILAQRTAQDSLSRSIHWFELCYQHRNHFIVLAAGCFVLCLLLFLFLLRAAGHRDETDAVTPGFVEKIPFDLFAVLVFLALAFCVVLIDWIGFDGAADLVLNCGVLLAAGLLVLLLCMSFAVRVKLGSLIRGCLLYKLCRWGWRLLKTLWAGLLALIHALPLVWRWAVLLLGAAFLEFVVLALSDGEGVPLWFLQNLIGIPLLLYVALCLRRLRLGAKEIARGNYAYNIDTRYMLGELKDQAVDLNHIREGMTRAVDERMKSERFRTELITNVSHDIKTPLTSIVNYVDLLAKEEPENENMREYIEVLSRQSGRLKKLIDDLIEASKASTGNLSVNPERIELGVLIDQSAGEYGEKLSAAGLELVVSKPEHPVTVLADGRHMWRIFDNLLNNIVKYGQPGTRVYLDLAAAEGQATVTFRNISRSRLNISGEELMERFVRGDSSRNTEGSGLGLSIALSLVRLQRGEMDLNVDGDLFKVTLKFDEI